jgi:hypothetical protein
MSPAQEYWFPAKRYGWGWGLPIRWQGWLVLIAYIALVIGTARVFHPHQHLLVFLLLIVVYSFGFFAVCWLKGEPPHWRWGGD